MWWLAAQICGSSEATGWVRMREGEEAGGRSAVEPILVVVGGLVRMRKQTGTKNVRILGEMMPCQTKFVGQMREAAVVHGRACSAKLLVNLLCCKYNVTDGDAVV